MQVTKESNAVTATATSQPRFKSVQVCDSSTHSRPACQPATCTPLSIRSASRRELVAVMSTVPLRKGTPTADASGRSNKTTTTTNSSSGRSRAFIKSSSTSTLGSRTDTKLSQVRWFQNGAASFSGPSSIIKNTARTSANHTLY